MALMRSRAAMPVSQDARLEGRGWTREGIYNDQCNKPCVLTHMFLFMQPAHTVRPINNVLKLPRLISAVREKAPGKLVCYSCISSIAQCL